MRDKDKSRKLEPYIEIQTYVFQFNSKITYIIISVPRENQRKRQHICPEINFELIQMNCLELLNNHNW